MKLWRMGQWTWAYAATTMAGRSGFRLPEAGGLYHGDTGFFPKYSGGMYQLRNGTIFVSRGMGGHNGLPRVNNRPELAVIDINGRPETAVS